MIKMTATRRLQFCAGHRVMGHENKCKHIHGHNYVAFIYARGTKRGLDSLGRVIDFGILKERVGGWIEDNWDHKFICAVKDTAIAMCFREFNAHAKTKEEGFTQGVYKLDENPTAENMAKHLLHEVCPEVLKDTGVVVYKVVLWETENCFAFAEDSSDDG